MQLIIGRLVDVTEATREYEGRSWIEHTAHVLDGINMAQVTLQGPSRDGKSRGLDPVLVKADIGKQIALETYSRPGKTRVYITATAVRSGDDIANALGLLSA